MSNSSGIVEVALKISARRREILRQMREALTRNDDQTALRFARQLCDLEDESVGRALLANKKKSGRKKGWGELNQTD